VYIKYLINMFKFFLVFQILLMFFLFLC